MALTRAIAASGEQISNTELTVTNALTVNAVVFLPGIKDGSGATVAESAVVTIYNNGTAYLEVLDSFSRRVYIMAPGEATQFDAKAQVTSALDLANTWLARPYQEALSFKASQIGTNGAVVPTLSSNGPTSMTAASAGWLKIVSADGVARYIPFWTA
jgi:hypothetical protein